MGASTRPPVPITVAETSLGQHHAHGSRIGVTDHQTWGPLLQGHFLQDPPVSKESIVHNIVRSGSGHDEGDNCWLSQAIVNYVENPHIVRENRIAHRGFCFLPLELTNRPTLWPFLRVLDTTILRGSLRLKNPFPTGAEGLSLSEDD